MFYSAKLKLITIYLSSMIKRVIKCSPYVRRPNSWFFHTCKSESYGWLWHLCLLFGFILTRIRLLQPIEPPITHKDCIALSYPILSIAFAKILYLFWQNNGSAEKQPPIYSIHQNNSNRGTSDLLF